VSIAPAVAELVAPLLGWEQGRIALETERYTREVNEMFTVGPTP
jgi:hypothetical protein